MIESLILYNCAASSPRYALPYTFARVTAPASRATSSASLLTIAAPAIPNARPADQKGAQRVFLAGFMHGSVDGHAG